VQNFGKHLPHSLLVLPEGERSWVFSLFVFAAFCSGATGVSRVESPLGIWRFLSD